MKILIPAENIESLSKKITALSNKAERLELPPISLDINYGIGIATPDKKDKSKFTETEYYGVEILGEPPVLSGWIFIGIVEPTEKGNLLIEINPNNKIPDKYRHTDLCDCEHCGIKRDRLSAFIVQNETTGEVLQVGRTCLKSYTNDTDPKNIALYESFFKLKEFEKPIGNGKFKSVYNPESVLAYYFKTKEMYPELNKYKISNISLNTIPFGTNPLEDEFYKQLREIRSEVGTSLTDIDYEKAKNFIKSINELNDEGNNRLWNYKLTLNDKYTTNGQLIIQSVEFKEAHDLHLTLEEKRLKEQLERMRAKEELDAAKKLRTHVGVEGEKQVFHVRLDSFKVSHGDFGTTFIHTFRDKDDNNITWFCNGRTFLDDDEAVKKAINDKNFFYIQGTVGKHLSYNDEPQTKVLRVKYLGEEEPKLEKKKKLKI